MPLCGMAAPEPEATTRMASGLAATSLSAWPVTAVSLRAKRSVATILMPGAILAASAWKSLSQLSP